MTKAATFFIGILMGSISAAATFWLISQAENEQPAMAEKTGDGDLQIRDIQERLEQLERQIQHGTTSTPSTFVPDVSARMDVANAITEAEFSGIPRQMGFGPWGEMSEESHEERLNRLVGAGFSVAEADEVLRIKDQEHLEQSDQQYEMMKNAIADNPDMARMILPDSGLREKLGESAYERYLQAYDLPTSVGIGGVFPGSRGELAGLQPGDDIIRYDDQRIYNPMDLEAATLKGDKDESVMMIVRRNGVDIQLVIPRGPVGAR